MQFSVHSHVLSSMNFCSLLVLLGALVLSQAEPVLSPKRGLVYVPSTKYPKDDNIWDSPGSDLSWYYSYSSQAASIYATSQLSFVPQLWGRPTGINDTVFLNSVTSQIKSGVNISYVLGFNEPDNTGYGASTIDPLTASLIWKAEIQPLTKYGVKLGSPACSSAPAGIDWMKKFVDYCKDCTIDFIALHYYGDFEGLASHIGEYVATFNKTVWLTEWAFPNVTLPVTQTFYNQSIEFLDRNPNVTRYSYFGAFRSDVSNVGPNVPFLTPKGTLTDIGRWYMGDLTSPPTANAAGKAEISHKMIGTLLTAVVFLLSTTLLA